MAIIKYGNGTMAGASITGITIDIGNEKYAACYFYRVEFTGWQLLADKFKDCYFEKCTLPPFCKLSSGNIVVK